MKAGEEKVISVTRHTLQREEDLYLLALNSIGIGNLLKDDIHVGPISACTFVDGYMDFSVKQIIVFAGI